MVEAVFFDNDGVLVDTERLYFQATSEVLERKGISLTEELYVEYLLRQGKGAWFLLEESGCPAREISDLRRERNRIYSDLLQTETILVEDVDAALKRLYGIVIMGIVTSSKRDHFEIIHRKTGILPYFDFYLTREDYANSKPDPEPYLRAIEKTGLTKDECLVVEDSERGLLSALNAGLRCIVVPRGMTREGRFDRALRIEKSLMDAVDEILKSV